MKTCLNEKTPLVSIIIPCLNSAKTLEATLVSVLTQSYSHLEVIVVDGASTDGTLDLIDKYKDKIHKFFSGKDSGTSEAMNRGVQMCSGELVTFLNADDEFFNSEVVASMLELYLSNRDSKFLLSEIEVRDPEGFFKNWILKSDPSRLHRKMTVCFPGAFFKREILLDKPFSSTIDYANDYEFFSYLIFHKKMNYSTLNKPTIKFSLGGRSNEGKNAWKIFLEITEIRRRYIGWASLLKYTIPDGTVAILRQSGFRPFKWWRNFMKNL